MLKLRDLSESGVSQVITFANGTKQGVIGTLAIWVSPSGYTAMADNRGYMGVTLQRIVEVSPVTK